MTPTSRRAVVLSLLAVAAGAPALANQQLVIPPGQERLLGAMVGVGDVKLAGCRLSRASVQKAHVMVDYVCPEPAGAVRVVLYPPTWTGEAAARTEKFVVAAAAGTTLPDGLAEAVAERLRKGEQRWHWLKVQGEVIAPEPIGPTAPLPPEQPAADGELNPEHVGLFERGMALYGDKKHAEALELFIELARANPRFAGALGMVVANLAPTHPDAEGVARYAADADAHPEDLVRQFTAGVAAHYSAHYTARTPEVKQALYAQSIRYLERVRPEFDFEPRVFIYLAVSHYRLGHQEKAEALIEQGVAIASHDPDAYYCRAEILHRVDTDRALADLDRYLEMIERFRGAGGWVADTKVARVKAMQDHLRRVAAGEEELSDLFDPLASDSPGEVAPTAQPEAPAPPILPQPVEEAVRSPRSFAGLVIGVAAVVGLLLLGGLLLTRRQRRRTS